MLDTPLNNLTESDLEDLVDNSIQESKNLEYKKYLDPSNNNKHKSSLLAEVTSFANARGGDLIVGIDEDNGIPNNLGGVPLSNSADQTVETWGNILRRQTEPKLPTTVYDIEAISLNNGRHAIIVRVERSWQNPHRVRTNDRFYGRHASGKFPMTVGEIREQIIAGQDRQEKLAEFRAERISEFLSGNTPVPTKEGPKFLLHLVPYEAFTPGENIDLSTADVLNKSPVMFLSRPTTGGLGDRYMVDSVTKFAGGRQNDHAYYTRTFKNGAIEGYTSVGFSSEETSDSRLPYLHVETVEETLNRALPDYLGFLRQQGLNPPLYVAITILGAKEHTVLSDENHIPMDPIPFDREVLQIPVEVIESYESGADDVISTILESLWNAAGKRDSTDI